VIQGGLEVAALLECVAEAALQRGQRLRIHGLIDCAQQQLAPDRVEAQPAGLVVERGDREPKPKRALQ
jgi:hypothetical protein